MISKDTYNCIDNNCPNRQLGHTHPVYNQELEEK